MLTQLKVSFWCAREGAILCWRHAQHLQMSLNEEVSHELGSHKNQLTRNCIIVHGHPIQARIHLVMCSPPSKNILHARIRFCAKIMFKFIMQASNGVGWRCCDIVIKHIVRITSLEHDSISMSRRGQYVQSEHVPSEPVVWELQYPWCEHKHGQIPRKWLCAQLWPTHSIPLS